MANTDREKLLKEIGRRAREASQAYEKAMADLKSVNTELTFLEIKAPLYVPEMRRTFGSDEAILEYVAKNFSIRTLDRMRRILKQTRKEIESDD